MQFIGNNIAECYEDPFNKFFNKEIEVKTERKLIVT